MKAKYVKWALKLHTNFFIICNYVNKQVRCKSNNIKYMRDMFSIVD